MFLLPLSPVSGGFMLTFFGLFFASIFRPQPSFFQLWFFKFLLFSASAFLQLVVSWSFWILILSSPSFSDSLFQLTISYQVAVVSHKTDCLVWVVAVNLIKYQSHFKTDIETNRFHNLRPACLWFSSVLTWKHMSW